MPLLYFTNLRNLSQFNQIKQIREGLQSVKHLDCAKHIVVKPNQPNSSKLQKDKHSVTEWLTRKTFLDNESN